MPRTASHTAETLADRALRQFWTHGFHATSMDDLVRMTSVSRHGIYSAFNGKHGLFLACFERYRDTVVSPAFHIVEENLADLATVGRYFDFQISRAEEFGLPGPGCFVANSATEVAPADADVLSKVTEHNDRLQLGFENALRNACPEGGHTSDSDLTELARTIVIFTNGLWTISRLTADAEDLRRSVRCFLKSIAEQLR
jgi:TetR/AcrR family transcriptional regulator, transcriptional repressor for nem operon